MATVTEDFTNESCFTEWLSEASVGSGDDKLLIKNVTLCGNESKNGYKIPPSAFKSEGHVRHLYEGKHVYLDHNMDRNGRRMNPMARSVRELAAIIENVRFPAGKPIGDFRCLDNEAGRSLISIANAKANDIGPSHVAAYEYSSDRKSVSSVNEIASVDIVCFPATTRNFSEQHHGENDMADGKLEAHLESQIKELQTKVQTLESEKAALGEQVKSLSAEKDASAEKSKALTEENSALKLKVDNFETKEALETRRSEIHKQLESAKLDPKDTAQVTTVFMESLMGIEDAAKRKELIDDRAALVGESKSGNGRRTPTSTERRADGGTPATSSKFESKRWEEDKDKMFAE